MLTHATKFKIAAILGLLTASTASTPTRGYAAEAGPAGCSVCSAVGCPSNAAKLVMCGDYCGGVAFVGACTQGNCLDSQMTIFSCGVPY